MVKRNDLIAVAFVALVLAAVGYLWMTDGSQPKHDSHGSDHGHGEEHDDEHGTHADDSHENETAHAQSFFELKRFNHAF